jgi:hypothetical protein
MREKGGEKVMELTESREQPPSNLVDSGSAPAVAPMAAVNAATALYPQTNGSTCSSCAAGTALSPDNGTAASYVFAIGRIEVRFPTLGMEKELAQATSRADTAGKTDRGAIHTVLGERANRYLARRLCWVLTIEGMETYILVPRDPADYDQLVAAVRPAPSPLDLDVVIGVRGPMSPPQTCNGLTVPIVAFDQIYSFDRDALIRAIPRPERKTAEEFGPAASELFDRIMLLADNAGATDEHRALNYLAVRYPAIYATTAEEFAGDSSLTAVDVLQSPLSGVRNIVDVVFSFTNRNTDVVHKFFTRVDVTEEFPFLVTKMSAYFDR